jgi:hypothetical protein
LSSQSASPGLLLVLALACLGGATTLAWFSSPATMTLTRTDDKKVAVTFESRLFGLIPRSRGRIDNVMSVSTVTFRGPGSNSHTPDRIVFDTRSEAVDLGMVQQLFVHDFAEIKAFISGSTGPPGDGDGNGNGQASVERAAQPRAQPRTMTLSSIARGSELRRFAFAQLAVAFLTFLGLGVGWMGLKAATS